MSDVFEFLSSSKHFDGFVMQGCYNISASDVRTAYEHYLATGENILDEHAKINYMLWTLADVGKGYSPTAADFYKEYGDLAKKVLSGKTAWNFLSDDQKEYLAVTILAGKRMAEHEQSYSERRKKSSSRIQNQASLGFTDRHGKGGR